MAARTMTTERYRRVHPGPPVKPDARRRSRLRERSLLLNPAPVIGAALAAFSLVLAGLTFRLQAGHDPSVGPVAVARRAASSVASAPLATRASGPSASTAGSRGSAVPSTAPLVTSTSGAVGGARLSFGGDDGE
jgi:hypothetical protein